LASDNLANRKMWTGVQGVRKGQSRNRTAVLVVEEGGGSGKSKKVYASVKAQVGESWYDFLRRQYKRVGLYLWCAGDGSFVLAAPDVGQPAVAAILRPEDSNAVGMFLPSKTQIVQHDYQLDLSRRHARARVWGRAGDADGRTKVKGQHDDAEAKELGLDPEIDSVDVHDSDVKTAKEAEFAAIRWIAEERRESFRLGYTVSGHTTPSLLGGRAVWAPDTVVDVQDDLLELSNTFYVGSVTFSGPPRTTRLQLHRLQDVWFGD
jgi:prophage tail gpP-like protein